MEMGGARDVTCLKPLVNIFLSLLIFLKKTTYSFSQIELADRYGRAGMRQTELGKDLRRDVSQVPGMFFIYINLIFLLC